MSDKMVVIDLMEDFVESLSSLLLTDGVETVNTLDTVDSGGNIWIEVGE